MDYNCSYILLSPAKINVFLKVVSKRSDGFHNIESLVQKISLFDTVSIMIKNDGRAETTVDFSNSPNIDKKSNTVTKSINLFRELTGNRDSYLIKIDKLIPVEAGLGGGSSNAGVILRFINLFYREPLNFDELIEKSALIGSDVPLFISKQNTLIIKNKGEALESAQNPFQNHSILLIKPDFSISTKWAYKNLNFELTKPKKNISNFHLFNDLEDVVIREYPIIQHIKTLMLASGADLSLMSGSGSSLFGYFPERERIFSCIESINRTIKVDCNFIYFICKNII